MRVVSRVVVLVFLCVLLTFPVSAAPNSGSSSWIEWVSQLLTRLWIFESEEDSQGHGSANPNEATTDDAPEGGNVWPPGG